MSVVGMIHIQCGHVGRCANWAMTNGHVFAVNADDYLRELAAVVTEAALNGHPGSYTYPMRYCPACEARANHSDYESDRERDERMEVTG